MKPHGTPPAQWGARSRARTPLLHLDQELNVIDACCVSSDVFIVPPEALTGRPLAEVARPGFAEVVQRVLADHEESCACGQCEVGIEWAEDGQVGVWEVMGYRLHNGAAIVLIRNVTEIVTPPICRTT